MDEAQLTERMPDPLKVIFRKVHTLRLNPVGVYRKYVGKTKTKVIKLSGGVPPIYGEDYKVHWGFTSFKGKIVLDLGADCGSTAYYFLHSGARRVVAVEGNPQLASLLRKYSQRDGRVVPVELFIDDPAEIEGLIRRYSPDLVKVDIEGSEKHLLGVSNIVQVKEWLIEAHSNELHRALSSFLSAQGFRVRSFHYLEKLWVIYASV
jgi:hypothetical protein